MSRHYQWWQDPNLLTNNIMREPGVEPGCPKAPDPKSSTPPGETPNKGQATRTDPHPSAPFRAGHVTKSHTAPFSEARRPASRQWGKG